MKLSDYVMNFFIERGVSHLFYLPGGGCMHLVDSVGKSRITPISLLHEQAVAIAAESYAMTTGSTSVALVTTGPGGTNAVTGVLSAFVDSTPCVFISGQVKTSDLKSHFGVRQMGSQEADIVSIVKSITKYAVMVTDKDSIRAHMEEAWYWANEGRKGPVWIDIPLDIQGSTISPETLKGFEPPINMPISLPIDDIVKEIKKSKKPLIIAGNGLRGCTSDFYTLLDKLHIPVIPTWKAMDLIGNDNPLFVGKCGIMGDRTGNFAIQSADLIISLGSKLDFSITGFERASFGKNARKIVVDIDESEIKKLGDLVDTPVVADVQVVLKELLKHDIHTGDYSEWMNLIKDWKKQYPVITPQHFAPDKPITTYALIDTICKNLSKDAVVVPCSAGTAAEITFQAFSVKQGQTIRSNHGLGSMGYEIPSAIGACIATNKQVVCIAGDGGMQLNIQELAVISKRKLPIVIFVINNNGYASIRNMQRTHFEGHYVGSEVDSGLFLPDITQIAQSYGIKSTRIAKSESLESMVKEVLKSDGPFICDVVVDEFCVVLPKVTAKVLPDGSLKSGELEDMFPFLNERN